MKSGGAAASEPKAARSRRRVGVDNAQSKVNLNNSKVNSSKSVKTSTRKRAGTISTPGASGSGEGPSKKQRVVNSSSNVVQDSIVSNPVQASLAESSLEDLLAKATQNGLGAQAQALLANLLAGATQAPAATVSAPKVIEEGGEHSIDERSSAAPLMSCDASLLEGSIPESSVADENLEDDFAAEFDSDTNQDDKPGIIRRSSDVTVISQLPVNSDGEPILDSSDAASSIPILSSPEPSLPAASDHDPNPLASDAGEVQNDQESNLESELDEDDEAELDAMLDDELQCDKNNEREPMASETEVTEDICSIEASEVERLFEDEKVDDQKEKEQVEQSESQFQDEEEPDEESEPDVQEEEEEEASEEDEIEEASPEASSSAAADQRAAKFAALSNEVAKATELSSKETFEDKSFSSGNPHTGVTRDCPGAVVTVDRWGQTIIRRPILVPKAKNSVDITKFRSFASVAPAWMQKNASLGEGAHAFQNTECVKYVAFPSSSKIITSVGSKQTAEEKRLRAKERMQKKRHEEKLEKAKQQAKELEEKRKVDEEKIACGELERPKLTKKSITQAQKELRKLEAVENIIKGSSSSNKPSSTLKTGTRLPLGSSEESVTQSIGEKTRSLTSSEERKKRGPKLKHDENTSYKDLNKHQKILRLKELGVACSARWTDEKLIARYKEELAKLISEEKADEKNAEMQDKKVIEQKEEKEAHRQMDSVSEPVVRISDDKAVKEIVVTTPTRPRNVIERSFSDVLTPPPLDPPKTSVSDLKPASSSASASASAAAESSQSEKRIVQPTTPTRPKKPADAKIVSNCGTSVVVTPTSRRSGTITPPKVWLALKPKPLTAPSVPSDVLDRVANDASSKSNDVFSPVFSSFSPSNLSPTYKVSFSPGNLRAGAYPARFLPGVERRRAFARQDAEIDSLDLSASSKEFASSKAPSRTSSPLPARFSSSPFVSRFSAKLESPAVQPRRSSRTGSIPGSIRSRGTTRTDQVLANDFEEIAQEDLTNQSQSVDPTEGFGKISECSDEYKSLFESSLEMELADALGLPKPSGDATPPQTPEKRRSRKRTTIDEPAPGVKKDESDLKKDESADAAPKKTASRKRVKITQTVVDQQTAHGRAEGKKDDKKIAEEKQEENAVPERRVSRMRKKIENAACAKNESCLSVVEKELPEKFSSAAASSSQPAESSGIARIEKAQIDTGTWDNPKEAKHRFRHSTWVGQALLETLDEEGFGKECSIEKMKVRNQILETFDDSLKEGFEKLPAYLDHNIHGQIYSLNVIENRKRIIVRNAVMTSRAFMWPAATMTFDLMQNEMAPPKRRHTQRID